MVQRHYWIDRITTSWSKRSIVWLAGVRRSGKSTLMKSLAHASFFNCDDSDIQEKMQHETEFLNSVKTPVLILDEIHQLDNASELLKIAADDFPKLKVVATGSSTLAAGKKFRDTLTGRKRNLHFLPILPIELDSFGLTLDRRIAQGGLPPASLLPLPDPEFYAEWMDSFYARDVQEIFSIEKRQAFLKILEYLLMQNGSLIDLTEIGKVSGLSRPTVVRYLDVLEITKAISVIKPFSSNPLSEIISLPKVYGFDTGFVCFARKSFDLGATEKGHLLENLVLESMQAIPGELPVRFWRDKQKHEIDFVVPLNSKNILAIECKSKSREFGLKNLERFRNTYPRGENWVITMDSRDERRKTAEGIEIRFLGLIQFFEAFERIAKTYLK